MRKALFSMACFLLFSFTSSQSNLVELKHLTSTLQSEVGMLRKSLQIQEDNLSSMRNELDQIRSESRHRSDQKVKSLESRSKTFQNDIQTLSNHANESISLLESYRKKIDSLEQTIAQQNRNIANLQSALSNLVDAVGKGGSVTTVAAEGRETYKVQSGDSLEKIAKKFKTDVKSLMTANDLKTDLIVIGQKLVVPQ